MILPIKNRLAKNPSGSLKFSTTAKLSSGEKIELADPRSTRALVALMDMNAVIGGAASHYGGPAAFAELMSALHGLVFTEAIKKNKNWFELYNLVNDAGHCENGLYALKANYGFADLTLEKLSHFRSIDSKLTGHGESHLFPEGVFLSNGPLGSSLGQSQGLAMADRLAKNSRLTVAVISDGACMEGEAREALAAIPGFAKKGQLNPFVLIVSDNNTKLSGRIDKDSFSMNPTFKSCEALGWRILNLENGNDLQSCLSTIEKALSLAHSNPNEPILIHAKTVKGLGTKKTAESSSGGHGFPLKSAKELHDFISEIYSGEQYPTEFAEWIKKSIQLEEAKKSNSNLNSSQQNILGTNKEDKIQIGISASMIKAKKAGLPIVSITSDLPGSTGVAGFRKEFPSDSFDVGVAESNMISTAAGFSKVGFIPVVDTFAQFGVTKGALPLIMSSLSQAPMIAVFSHTGFQDAADGASHQALSYLAMVNSIPHVDTYCLSCAEEAEQIMDQIISKFNTDVAAGKTPNTSVLFLGRENFPLSLGAKEYTLGKSQVLYNNFTSDPKSNVLIIGVGSQTREAVNLINKSVSLADKKITIVNSSITSKVDFETIVPLLQQSAGKVIIVEDHQKIGGYAQLFTLEIVKFLNSKSIDLTLTIKQLAVDQKFGQSAYMADHLYNKHNIDSLAIANAVKEL